MTVNANVRCVEWFDTNMITPMDCRYVLGWFVDGFIRICRLNGDMWQTDYQGPGGLRLEAQKPTHWCEFPSGPDSAETQEVNDGT